MKKVTIENNILKLEHDFNTRYFEIVEKMPIGYIVWNIGDNMADGWLPICKLANDKESPYSIDVTTLKAIKMSDEDLRIIRKVAGCGYSSKATPKRKIKAAAKWCSQKMIDQATAIYNTISE